MTKLTNSATKTLSFRISLKIVSAIAVLLTVALFVMFRFSRKAIKEEALNKAKQTVEAAVQQVDNILLSVEQSTGNIYWDLLFHMNSRERMFIYCRKLVETNHYITGAAIALEPHYYKDHGRYFMAYVHRSADDHDELVQATSFGSKPYTEQSWYTEPVGTGSPCWINPLKNEYTEDEPIITYSLPVYSVAGSIVGVLAVDVSLELLSDIILAAKPSANSYATLLGSDGSFIIHPDSTILLHHSIFSVEHKAADPTFMEAAKAMMAGQTGYKKFRLNGSTGYVFYKPFNREAMPGRPQQKLNWSIGMVYPEQDIFSDYNRLLYIVLAIAVISLLLLLVCCWFLTHRQLLPLRMLAHSAQRIAEGHYTDAIPDSRQSDEIGRLQDNFQQMQKALATRVGELERLSGILSERGRELSKTYEKSRDADLLKTAFLHNMTNQMIAPVNCIEDNVDQLRKQGESAEKAKNVEAAVSEIQNNGKAVAELLDSLLQASFTNPEEYQ